MLVEIHMLQNHAPSNLNRDDTGSPKDAVFGGVRRARVSSQSFKRAIRKHFANAQLLTPDETGIRTRKAHSELVSRLEKAGVEKAADVAEKILGTIGLKIKKDKKSDPEAGALT